MQFVDLYAIVVVRQRAETTQKPMKKRKMNESLDEVLHVSYDYPYGFHFGWSRHLQEMLEGGAVCELTSADVALAMDCAGMWAATQETKLGHGLPTTASRQVLLTRQMARLWVNRGREATGFAKPFLFVEALLNDSSWMTQDVCDWVGKQSFEERVELVGEVAAVLCRLDEELQEFYLYGVGLECPEVPEVKVGNLTLISDDVDLRVGKCEYDEEGAWARTVLLALVPEKPTRADLERLGFSAAMHTLSTGCPPARVAAYGLLDGKLTSLDVDAEWIALQIGFIMATRKVIERVQTEEEPLLTPGRYCANCPARQACPFSRFGLEEF